MAINWTAVQDALRTWFVGATGLPGSNVIFFDQHAPEPNPPWATILVRPARMVGGRPDELRYSTASSWAPSASYSLGVRVINGLNLYQCTSAGKSALSGGPVGTGVGIIDNTVTWAYVSASLGAEVLPTVVGQREFVVSFEVYSSSVTSSGTALEYLVAAQTAFAFPSAQALFAGTATAFCFVGSSQPQDLTSLVSTQFQSRAAMDVRFRLVDSAADVPAGYIATVVVTPTYSF